MSCINSREYITETKIIRLDNSQSTEFSTKITKYTH